jgi:hypothetical protein
MIIENFSVLLYTLMYDNYLYERKGSKSSHYHSISLLDFRTFYPITVCIAKQEYD